MLDLLGLIAYAQLVAFFRLSDDAALAPTLADKAALAEMAVAEFGHFQLLRGRIEALGADVGEAMTPFVAALDDFHARTAPADWLEGLVKAYVGDGIAADFYRTVATVLDADTEALVLEVLADTGHSAFVIDRVRAAIAADPRVAGRLALWAPPAGRRGVRPGPAGRRRAGAAGPPAGRRLAPARRPGPDVRLAHRRPRGPDGRPGPVRLAHPANSGAGSSALVRARKAAVLTRFWQAVEQKRRVPLREVST